MNKLTILLCLMLGSGSLLAQDPVFSQFYLNKLYMNPSYAGINRDLNMSINHRTQWSQIAGPFRTTSLSADIGNPCRNLGFGFLLSDNREGEGLLRTTQLAGIVAAHVPISDRMVASAGLKMGIGRKTLDWSKLQFTDQLDPIYGFIHNTAAMPQPAESQFMINATAGSVVRYRWNEKNSFSSLGFTLNHFNQPNESFVGLDSRLPMRATFHSYHHVRVNSMWSQIGPMYLSGGVIYERQQNLETLNIGSSLTFGNNLLIGLWYRNQNFKVYELNRDALITNFTLNINNLVIGYNYDLTISDLRVDNTHGTHEISLMVMLFGKYFCSGTQTSRYRHRNDCFIFDMSLEKPTFNNQMSRWGSGSSPWIYILP